MEEVILCCGKRRRWVDECSLLLKGVKLLELCMQRPQNELSRVSPNSPVGEVTL